MIHLPTPFHSEPMTRHVACQSPSNRLYLMHNRTISTLSPKTRLWSHYCDLPADSQYDWSSCQHMHFSPRFKALILFLSKFITETNSFETHFLMVKKSSGGMKRFNTMSNRGGIHVSGPEIMEITQNLSPEQKQEILSYEWMPDNGSLMIYAESIDRLLIHGGQMNHQEAQEMQYKYMSDYVVNPWVFSLEFESKVAGRKRKDSKGAVKRSTLQSTQTSVLPASCQVTWNIQSIDTSQEQPPPRYHHAGCIWKKYNLLVHGGQTVGMKNLNDLWCLNLIDWQWRQIVTAGPDIPSARRMHSMEIVNDKYLFLFGGLPLNSELYRLDLDTLQWVNIDFSLAPTRGLGALGGGDETPDNASMHSDAPHSTQNTTQDAIHPKFNLHASPRFGHTMNLIGNSLVLFGGQDMATYFTETIQIPLSNVDEFLRNVERYRIEQEAQESAKEKLLHLRTERKRRKSSGEWTTNSDNDSGLSPATKRGTPGSPADFTGFNDEADISSMLITNNDDGMDEIASYNKRKQLEETGMDEFDSDDSKQDDEIESLIFNDKVAKRFAKLRQSLKKKNKIIAKQKKQLQAKDEKIAQQQEEMQKLRDQVQQLQVSNRGLERFILSKGEEIPHDLLQFLPSGGPLRAVMTNSQGDGSGGIGVSGHAGPYDSKTGTSSGFSAVGATSGGSPSASHGSGGQGASDMSAQFRTGAGTPLIDRSFEKQDIDIVIKQNMEKSQKRDDMSSEAMDRLTENQILAMDKDKLTKTVRTKDFMIEHMRERMKQQETDLFVNDRLMEGLRQNNDKLKQRVQNMEEHMRTYREDIRNEYESKVDEMLKEKRDHMDKVVMETEFKMRTLEDRHESLLEEMLKMREENEALRQAQEMQAEKGAVKKCPQCGFDLSEVGQMTSAGDSSTTEATDHKHEPADHGH